MPAPSATAATSSRMPSAARSTAARPCCSPRRRSPTPGPWDVRARIGQLIATELRPAYVGVVLLDSDRRMRRLDTAESTETWSELPEPDRAGVHPATAPSP